MTFQPPPPPPPGGNPPPPGGNVPPGGGWGPPAGGPAKFDPKTVNPLDWGILAAGFLTLIFSFFDWYTVDVSGFGSGSESAWHGFFGWFAVLLALVGSGLVAASLFSPQSVSSLPVAPRLAGLGAYGVALISLILAFIVFPEDVPDNSGIDTGHGFGFWADAVMIIAGIALSLMRFQATGGQLPGGLNSKVPNVGGYGPQGGIGGGQPPAPGQTPPPPPGYGPPQ